MNDGLRSKLDDEVAALQKEDPEGPLKFLSPPVHLVKACPTRWNGEGAMIDRAIDLKDALQNLCGKPSLKLERCRLTRTEWEIMEQANPTLQVCFSRLFFLSKS